MLVMTKNKYHEDTDPLSQPIRGSVLTLRWWQISDSFLITVIINIITLSCQIFSWENNGSWHWIKGYGGHLWYLAVSGDEKNKNSLFDEIDKTEGEMN